MKKQNITVVEIRVYIQERDELNMKKQSNHGQRKRAWWKKILPKAFCVLIYKALTELWEAIF